MMTDQPTQHARRQRLHPRHRALVTESCATAVVACYLLALTRVPTVAAAVVLAAAAAAVAVTAVVQTSSAALGAAVAGWGVVLPGWLVYARVTAQPYSAAAVTALLAPALVLGGCTLAAYAHLHDDRRAARIQAERAAAAAALARWGQMLGRLGVEGVRASREDETRAGRDVTLVLPASGKVTIRTLVQVTDGAAVALGLQPESVYFEQGRSAAEVVMHLDEHDVMAEELPIPMDTGLLTVTRPLTVGAQGDGTPADILLRELGAMVLGMTGAGKTNLLNVLLALLTRCVDVVVFVIDLKGGRLAAPWVQPWVDGETPNPAIDWVATTREEAWLMLCAIDDLITARGASLAGGSKIRPTPQQPQVVLLADEIADMFGRAPKAEQGGVSNGDMAAKGGKIARKQRSEAVSGVWATQRGVADSTGGTELKSQCKLRFALGTAGEADARSAIADDAAAQRLVARLRHPGTGIIWLPGSARPQPVKFYRLDAGEDDDAAKIRRFAVAAGHHRPALDPLALAAMGDRYTRRWERSALYQQLAQQSPAAEELAAVPHPDKPLPPPAPMAAAAVSDEFARMMQAEGMAGAKPDSRGRMYALLAEVPNVGLSVLEIGARLERERIGVDRGTIHRWLRADLEAVPPRIVKRGDGQGARYLLAKQ
jgi:hypothetical protein